MYLAVYDDAKGIFHPYYTVVMAPAVAASPAPARWRSGASGDSRSAGPGRSRPPSWAPCSGPTSCWPAPAATTPGLGPTVVVTGVVSALVLFLCLARPRVPRWFAVAAGSVAAVSLLAGPAAYSLTTLGTTTNGIATAGPTSSAGGLGGGSGPGGQGGGRAAGGSAPTAARTGGLPGGGTAPTGAHTGAGAAAAGGGGDASTARHRSGALPRAAPRLRRVPGCGERLPDCRAVHPRERQGRHRHGRLHGHRPHTDTERVRASRRDRQGALRLRLERGGRGRGNARCWGCRDIARRHRLRSRSPKREHKTRTGLLSGNGDRSGRFSGTRRGGQTASTTSAVDSWVEKHGTVVSSSAYGGSSGGGTLYYVSSSAATK